MIEDYSIAAGMACVAYAGFQIHPAVCWAIVGAGLIAVGIGGIKRKAHRKNKQ